MIRIVFINLFFFTHILNAQVNSFFLENDVVSKKDRHYTNGLSFMYLSNNDINNQEKYDDKIYKFLNDIPTLNNNTKYQSFGINYSHLAFTPEDIKTKEKIKDDIPYAGVITLDFMLFKHDDDFFHEYMLTLGAVGPITKTKELQKGLHKAIDAPIPQGWDNQLENDFLYNITYAYGYNAYKKKFDNRYFNITHSLRADIGKLNRSIQFGSNFSFTNNTSLSLHSVGRFIGTNENKLLNIQKEYNKPNWAFSYGLIYYYNDYFYVTDYDNSYKNSNIRNIFTEIFSFDTYYKKFIFNINLKSSVLLITKTEKLKESWGGFSISYIF